MFENSERIDKENHILEKSIKDIVFAALQAPTPDNCQPYTYRWIDNKLEIYHHSELSDFAPDPHYRFSVFCLGIVSETIDIAASSKNLRPKFHYSLDSEKTMPWCTIVFKEVQREENSLIHAVFKRFSDRRKFAGGKLSKNIRLKLKNDSLDFNKCNIHLVDSCPEILSKYLYDAYGLAFYWRKFRGDLLKMWHISRKKAEKKRTGVTWLSLNMPKAALIMGRILHHSFIIGNKVFPYIYKSMPKNDYKDGAGLGCITVNSLTSDALVEAGRLCMRNWLRLNQLGFGYGPLGIVMHNYLLEEGTLGAKIPKAFKQIIAEGTDIIRKAFNLSEDEIPVWMFRTGLMKNKLPDEAWTLRLSVQSVSNLR